MKPVITADKSCKWCGGRGYAICFFGAVPMPCSCVIKQITVLDAKSNKPRYNDEGSIITEGDL